MQRELLNYLYQNYRPEYLIINDFLFLLFPSPTEATYKFISQEIKELDDKGLININGLYKNFLIPRQIREGDRFVTNVFSLRKDEHIPEFLIEAKITFDGIRDVEETSRASRAETMLRRQTSSIEQTNAQNEITSQSVVTTNTNQRILGWATLIVAGISAYAIIDSAKIAKKGVTSADIQHLDTLLQKQDSVLMQMQQYQKGIDSSLRSMAKDSVKRIVVLKK